MNLKVCFRSYLVVLAILLTAIQVSAQGVAVSGVVYEPDGTTPMFGASVSVQGTSIGMVTDVKGAYRLNVPSSSSVIVVQSLGYETQNIDVANRTTVNVTMREESTKIDDVVVTALGLTREEKSLGYAVTKIDGDAINGNASGNWLNSLSGKVAGLNFDQASSGPGGTVRVTLRGEGSLSHDNNEALFVIDGIPVNSPKIATGGGSSSNDNAPVAFGNNSSLIHL